MSKSDRYYMWGSLAAMAFGCIAVVVGALGMMTPEFQVKALAWIVVGFGSIVLCFVLQAVSFASATFVDTKIIGEYLVATHIQREGVPQKPIAGAPDTPDDRQRKIEALFKQFGVKR